jgi:hypothetical protein
MIKHRVPKKPSSSIMHRSGKPEARLQSQTTLISAEKLSSAIYIILSFQLLLAEDAIH